jgi:GNAT superfamily N-acetyltransferase
VIRDAVLGDAGAIAALVSQLGYQTTTSAMQERLSAILTDDGYATFVAESRGAVVGVVGIRTGRYYEHTGSYAQLLVLAVDEAAHGRGIGRALVEAAEKWALGRGAQTIVAHSGRHRTEAHAFYERVGYAVTGLRFVKELGDAAQPAAGPVGGRMAKAQFER